MPPQHTPFRSSLTAITELNHLSPAELALWATRCRWTRHAADSMIRGYHESSDTVFFVVEGSVRLTYHGLSGGKVILVDLPRGAMFGELSALDGGKRAELAFARTLSLVASIDAPAFLELVHANPLVSMAIMRSLSGQVRRLTERVFELSTLTVRNRIHAELWRLAQGRVGERNTAVISPSPTHSDLASLISTHREAVTRELSQLSRSNVIKREKHGLIILDVKRLKEMVDEARGPSIPKTRSDTLRREST